VSVCVCVSEWSDCLGGSFAIESRSHECSLSQLVAFYMNNPSGDIKCQLIEPRDRATVMANRSKRLSAQGACCVPCRLPLPLCSLGCVD
jgi:hypothetical protein